MGNYAAMGRSIKLLLIIGLAIKIIASFIISNSFMLLPMRIEAS